eukprot:s1935_g10.t1
MAHETAVFELDHSPVTCQLLVVRHWALVLRNLHLLELLAEHSQDFHAKNLQVALQACQLVDLRFPEHGHWTVQEDRWPLLGQTEDAQHFLLGEDRLVQQDQHTGDF